MKKPYVLILDIAIVFKYVIYILHSHHKFMKNWLCQYVSCFYYALVCIRNYISNLLWNQYMRNFDLPNSLSWQCRLIPWFLFRIVEHADWQYHVQKTHWRKFGWHREYSFQLWTHIPEKKIKKFLYEETTNIFPR